MASEAAASRRPPLPPPPKRRAAGDPSPNVLTYKRRRRATTATATATADENQKSMEVANSQQQGGTQALATHWRSWRDTLEGVLLSPSVSQGSGGIQSCIRDALRYNGCQPAERGNLGEGRERPSEANNSGALAKAKDAIVDNGDLVELQNASAPSLEANKAICHSALFDILVSEKFAFLCHLLAATFHVDKPDDVIGLQKIDAKMRNGDYAHNSSLIHQDIKQASLLNWATRCKLDPSDDGIHECT